LVSHIAFITFPSLTTQFDSILFVALVVR